VVAHIINFPGIRLTRPEKPMVWASAVEHERYSDPIDKSDRRRRMCPCGCRKRSTHRGKANGVTLMSGCELLVRRWVKDPMSAIRSLR
jgi:hypothetical protein